VHQEAVEEAEAAVAHRVGVDGAPAVERVVPPDMVKPSGIGATRIPMPRELVEEQEEVPVVVQMVEQDLVPGLAMAPALVRVVRPQPLPVMGLQMLKVMVGVKAKVLVPMGLADKEPGREVVQEVVRVA